MARPTLRFNNGKKAWSLNSRWHSKRWLKETFNLSSYMVIISIRTRSASLRTKTLADTALSTLYTGVAKRQSLGSKFKTIGAWWQLELTILRWLKRPMERLPLNKTQEKEHVELITNFFVAVAWWLDNLLARAWNRVFILLAMEESRFKTTWAILNLKAIGEHVLQDSSVILR